MTPRRLIEPARLAGTSMLRTQSDARLVDLVRAGHASAFEAIVQRYRKQLLAYCSRLLPASRAEDAVQQTFLKAYQSMISGDAELNLRPWLYRIAHNASLNLLRQNGWSHEQLDENMDGVQRPDQAFELRERLRSTVNAVKALPERQRNAVLLREVDGLSYEEIATALGVGDGAVRQLLHRARNTLRAGLTGVTPIGLLERLTAMVGTGADPSTRVAEVAAGIGLGTGAVKIGAAVLATSVIATGAVAVPLHKSHHAQSARAAAAGPQVASAPSGGGSASSGPDTPATLVDDHSGDGSGSHHGRRSHHRSGHDGKGSDDRHGASREGSGRHGSSGSGSDRSGSRSGSGSGEHHSGDDGSDRHRSGSDGGGDRHSGSGSGGSDGSSDGGGHGSDDAPATQLTEGEEQHGGNDGGSSDAPIVTVPTAPLPPAVEVDSDDGGGNSGPGSGSGG